jgi:hypothetical protein
MLNIPIKLPHISYIGDWQSISNVDIFKAWGNEIMKPFTNVAVMVFAVFP